MLRAPVNTNFRIFELRSRLLNSSPEQQTREVKGLRLDCLVARKCGLSGCAEQIAVVAMYVLELALTKPYPAV